MNVTLESNVENTMLWAFANFVESLTLKPYTVMIEAYLKQYER